MLLPLLCRTCFSHQCSCLFDAIFFSAVNSFFKIHGAIWISHGLLLSMKLLTPTNRNWLEYLISMRGLSFLMNSIWLIIFVDCILARLFIAFKVIEAISHAWTSFWSCCRNGSSLKFRIIISINTNDETITFLTWVFLQFRGIWFGQIIYTLFGLRHKAFLLRHLHLYMIYVIFKS